MPADILNNSCTAPEDLWSFFDEVPIYQENYFTGHQNRQAVFRDMVNSIVNDAYPRFLECASNADVASKGKAIIDFLFDLLAHYELRKHPGKYENQLKLHGQQKTIESIKIALLKKAKEAEGVEIGTLFDASQKPISRPKINFLAAIDLPDNNYLSIKYGVFCQRCNDFLDIPLTCPTQLKKASIVRISNGSYNTRIETNNGFEADLRASLYDQLYAVIYTKINDDTYQYSNEKRLNAIFLLYFLIASYPPVIIDERERTMRGGTFAADVLLQYLLLSAGFPSVRKNFLNLMEMELLKRFSSNDKEIWQQMFYDYKAAITHAKTNSLFHPQSAVYPDWGLMECLRTDKKIKAKKSCYLTMENQKRNYDGFYFYSAYQLFDEANYHAYKEICEKFITIKLRHIQKLERNTAEYIESIFLITLFIKEMAVGVFRLKFSTEDRNFIWNLLKDNLEENIPNFIELEYAMKQCVSSEERIAILKKLNIEKMVNDIPNLVVFMNCEIFDINVRKNIFAKKIKSMQINTVNELLQIEDIKELTTQQFDQVVTLERFLNATDFYNGSHNTTLPMKIFHFATSLESTELSKRFIKKYIEFILQSFDEDNRLHRLSNLINKTKVIGTDFLSELLQYFKEAILKNKINLSICDIKYFTLDWMKDKSLSTDNQMRILEILNFSILPLSQLLKLADELIQTKEDGKCIAINKVLFEKIKERILSKETFTENERNDFHNFKAKYGKEQNFEIIGFAARRKNLDSGYICGRDRFLNRIYGLSNSAVTITLRRNTGVQSEFSLKQSKEYS